MLVLSRKIGESVILPTRNVVLTIVEVQGNRVRLGFTAPEDVVIHREEVMARVQGFQEPVGSVLEPHSS